ncbi:hypothetical protein E4U43_006370 [Claviceps pusilla]|uniref:DNA mismatch repair protein S5 domain-containing protein n=1 Tax=Claviceps pusilla TaxID=123648 RepID=A0A9P7NG47_9HYPO|nr:hypothetical protein E4U43_006370 [Claviceps pusilla]
MSIQALPPSTAQLLQCSMNITTPCDLVKELIDNAVDAKATAIEITVSSNTIDRISVKDNGTGIDIDDFNFLGRRAHTSKLRAFEELASLGANSLGFRGEALASANALSNIVIITKKARDPVAWRIELVHGAGGVRAKQPVSATVGTTVAATKLFENMSPRKKTLLKEKNKTMANIQDILKAYALARPRIKWSLKVVGDSKPTWSYSPASVASGREAILQLFGASLVERCTEISETTPDTSAPSTGPPSKPADWVFSGYIGCQPSKSTCRRGVFISIDGRPMSSSWHISKKIANIGKSHAVKTREHNKSLSSTGHVFVQLNIQCPPMSYDPNVAARKDEVLFSDEKSLLKRLEVIFEKSLSQDLQSHPTTLSLASSICETSGATPRYEDSHKVQSAHETNGAVRDGTSPQLNNHRHHHQHHHNNNFESDGHNVLNNKEQDCVEHAATKQPIVGAILQTSFSVNMSNKDNDEASDDGNGLDVIHVEIARRASPFRIDDQVRKDNIRHYFHPVARQDFDIACDETATTSEMPEDQKKGQLTNSYSPDRSPLKPLTASHLNKMRDEAEIRLEQQPVLNFGNAHLVRPVNELPPSQSVNNEAGDGSRTGGPGGSFQQPSVPIRRTQNNREAAIMAPFLGHTPRVLTPPPSDSRNRNDRDSPPLRPRLPLFDASPTPAATTNRFNNRRAAIASAAPSTRQSERPLRRDIGRTGSQAKFVVPWLRDEGSRSSHGGGTMDQQFTRVAQNPFDKFASRYSTAVYGRPVGKPLVPLQSLPLAESIDRSPSMEEEEEEGRATPPEIGGLPLGYSHAAQIDLARTPAPMQRFDAAASSSRLIRGLEDTELMDTKDYRQMVDAEWPAAELPMIDESSSSPTSVCERNSADKYDGFESDISARLLFRSEDVANTKHLRTTIDTGHSDIERLVSQYAKVDHYELPGDIAVTLLTANLDSIQSVQRRLRWCVDSWMHKNQIRSQVDYMM